METRELTAKDWLGRLPDPDPTAPDRIRRRFEGRERRRPAGLGRAAVPLALAAAAGLYLSIPEAGKSVRLEGGGEQTLAWSDTATLAFTGHGTATGTSRDVVVSWDSGTLRAEVEPGTGTQLSVVTDEGTVRVIGTAFSVRRDPLGSSVWVEHGRVRVACAEGATSQELGPEDGVLTCLPTRPAGLLGRADALALAGAPVAEVLATLDLGLERAEPSSVAEGELLARRVRFRGESGEVAGALEDAGRYVGSGLESRLAEVRRTAGRLALAHGGCDAAIGWLEGGSAEDRVVLASCVAPSDPQRARRLAEEALASGEPIEAAWRAWAVALVGGDR